MPFLDREVWNWVAGGLLPPRAVIDSAATTDKQGVFGNNRFLPVVEPRRSLTQPDASLRTCGAPGCGGSWAKSRKKRRPVFEEEWGCTSACLQVMIRAALRRLSGDNPEESDHSPHRHRVPLGLVLLAQRWITHPQLQAALEEQRTAGQGRIGELLSKNCGLPEDRITRALALQWSCPVLTLHGFEPGRMALIMPPRLCAEFGLMPLRIAGSGLLYLASADRMDASVALAVEKISGLKVESGLLNESEMELAQSRLYAAQAVPDEVRQAKDTDDLVMQTTRLLEAKQPIASRMARVHGYYWLRLWLEQGSFGGTGMIPGSAEEVEDYLFTISSRSTV